MSRRFEAQMIPSIFALMQTQMGLNIVTPEFSAGYGRADLIGAKLSSKSILERSSLGIDFPLDRFYYIELLLALKSGIRRSMEFILSKVSYAESTLRKKVIPSLVKFGIIKRYPDDYYQLVQPLVNPTEYIVAVEAKQTLWKKAIVQARRYSYFANQSYIAVWKEIIPRVDRGFLYQARVGLISVTHEKAEIVIEAPIQNPRSILMHTFCSEYIYGIALKEPQ